MSAATAVAGAKLHESAPIAVVRRHQRRALGLVVAAASVVGT